MDANNYPVFLAIYTYNNAIDADDKSREMHAWS